MSKLQVVKIAKVALQKVFERRAEIDDAVNWGSLSIVEVGWYNDRWLIFVEEAAPDACKFRAALYEAIKERLDEPIQILTEW